LTKLFLVTGIPAVNELFGDRAKSATASVQDFVGRFRPGDFGGGDRLQQTASVGGQRQRCRDSDAATAPFADVTDCGRGCRRTVGDGQRRRGPEVHASTTAAAAVDDIDILCDRGLRDGGQIAAVLRVTTVTATVAGAAQAEKIIRRDQKPGVWSVFHHT